MFMAWGSFPDLLVPVLSGNYETNVVVSRISG